MGQSLRSRRWLPWLLAIGAVLAVLATAVVVVAVVVVPQQTRDISHPYVEFSAPTAPPPAPPPATPSDENFSWPVFGYDNARSHDLPLRNRLYPPYHLDWKRGGRVLLEFPPVLYGRSMYVLKDDGGLVAMSRRTGQTLWARRFGALAASSPAVNDDTVFVTLLKRFRGARGGRIAAVAQATGRTRWSHKLAPTESSPLLVRGMVIFGTSNGTVYALNQRNGRVRWRFRASGAVKGGLAADGFGHLFFGDYSGHVYALHQRNGHLMWRVGTSGAGFGFSSGRFYSTPATAFGRVYIGNTDGFVYSFAASSGKLAWRTHTGGYVYGSPAIGLTPGPTVFIGSYDKHLYALNARSGRKRWVRKAPGRISGSAVVLGDMVWYSTLNHVTEAVKARNGSPIYHTYRGYFNPIVSDGERIYLVGSTGIRALEPAAVYTARRRQALIHQQLLIHRHYKQTHPATPKITLPTQPLAPLVTPQPPQPLAPRR
jgi:outer membrane protein assembly factor BamB